MIRRLPLWILLGWGLGFGVCLGDAAREAIAEPDFEALSDYLKAEVEKGHISGAVGLIQVKGDFVYLEAVGMQDMEAKVPMKIDSLFRIASMTKALTSTAVMMLVEDGALELSDPVTKWVPEFSKVQVLEADGSVEEVRAPTIHELLTHTSGIGYGWFGPEAQDLAYAQAKVNNVLVPQSSTLETWVKDLASMPLAFEPGSQWSYGLSTDLLGRIIEVVSGKSLDDFFEERLLRPLGMADTHFFVDPEEAASMAALYTPQDPGKQLVRLRGETQAGKLHYSPDFCLANQSSFLSGGSGLVSTAEDYCRFLEIFLKEEKTVLKPESLEGMMSNQIGELKLPFPGHGDGFGYGFGVLTAAGKDKDVASVGTISWGGIFNTYYWVDPKEKMIGILMTQLIPWAHLDLRESFKRLAYEALQAKEEEE